MNWDFSPPILFIVSSVSLLLDKRSKTSFSGSSWHFWNLLHNNQSVWISRSHPNPESIIIGICTAMVSYSLSGSWTTGQDRAAKAQIWSSRNFDAGYLWIDCTQPIGGTLVKRFEGFSKVCICCQPYT